MRAQRAADGVSRATYAERYGVSVDSLRRYERGERCPPVALVAAMLNGRDADVQRAVLALCHD